MPDVITLTNSMPVALFGMFALWAAVSNRHWFLRTAVVAAAILVTLFIPAYEVVIMLAVESAIVVGGMALWRRRRTHDSIASDAVRSAEPFRVRLSMETLMLSVVIVAVVTALFARWPKLRPESWYQFALNGAHSGVIALACVWLVCGRARWWIRLAAAPLLILALSLTLISMRWAGHIASYWFRVTGRPIADYLQMALRDIWPSTLSWMCTVALGMAILCAWLFLMTRAGWFDPFCETSPLPPTRQARRTMLAARLAAFALIGIAAIFPLVLFYKLLTPTPLPSVKLPNPNGYDDILAAGRMIDPTAARTLENSDQLTTTQLSTELAKHTAVFELLQQALEKPCWNPFVYKSWTSQDNLALVYVYIALSAKGELARRTSDLPLELEHYTTMLRLAQEESRGTGAEFYRTVYVNYEPIALTGIWNCHEKLSARECIDLTHELLQIERSREPWSDRVERQRVIDENSGWERHLMTLVTSWSGTELFQWQTNAEKRDVAQFRMLIIKLALRAYELDHDQLPASLNQLVPDYLPVIPDDPFSGLPIRYRPYPDFDGDDDGYTLYSFGPDREDDDEKPLIGPEVDLTDEELFPLPTPPAANPPTLP
jgi:hypothetical protein